VTLAALLVTALAAGAQTVPPRQLSPALVKGVVDAALAEFDLVYGGFGRGAKAVPGPTLLLVARRLAETGDPRLRDVLTRTLDAMAAGAIRDHLEGGFFRATTDRAWRAPDFDRRDAVQAEAIVAYLLGYQATGDARYRAVAEATLAYVDRALARKGGGFSAGERGEGSRFLWNEADVRAAVPADGDLLVRHFGLAGVSERRPLAVDYDPAALAAESKVPLQDVERRLRDGRERMRHARAARGEPLVDDTVNTEGSARLASAYLEAYKVLGGGPRLRTALDTLEFLQARLRRPHGGMGHALRGDRTDADGSLDDQLAPAVAFLDAFEITGAGRYLDVARALVGHVADRFRAPDGGFFQTAGDAVPRQKRFDDGEGIAGNALAALVLERLHALTQEASYRTRARETLASLPGGPPLGLSLAGYAYTVDVSITGTPHVVVAGKASDSRTEVLLRGGLRAFRPGKIVERYDPDTSDLAAVPPPVAAVLRQQTAVAEPRAYVCTGNVCSLPQSDGERLRALVEQLGRRP
jgi:uncharacterized protein YyaL (SSP411 family)